MQVPSFWLTCPPWGRTSRLVMSIRVCLPEHWAGRPCCDAGTMAGTAQTAAASDNFGMSLGSVVASCLADQRPELVERMILMGTAQKTRKPGLRNAGRILTPDERTAYGWIWSAVILYLVNHARLTETRMSPTAKRLFFKQMAEIYGHRTGSLWASIATVYCVWPMCQFHSAKYWWHVVQYDILPCHMKMRILPCNARICSTCKLQAPGSCAVKLQRRKETMHLLQPFYAMKQLIN